jgi:hypothetical protein
MKGLLIFGSIILGSMIFLFYNSVEKLDHEMIAQENKTDLKTPEVRILSKEKRKALDFKKDIKIIRQINSEKMQPIMYLNYGDLDNLVEKEPESSAENKRLEEIYGSPRDPSPDFVFDPNYVPEDPNPYPKTPCTAL